MANSFSTFTCYPWASTSVFVMHRSSSFEFIHQYTNALSLGPGLWNLRENIFITSQNFIPLMQHVTAKIHSHTSIMNYGSEKKTIKIIKTIVTRCRYLYTYTNIHIIMLLRNLFQIHPISSNMDIILGHLYYTNLTHTVIISTIIF